MIHRRHFLQLAAAAAPLASASKVFAKTEAGMGFQPKTRSGIGGVAVGNGLKPTSDEDAHEALEAAWESGVRTFDTAPFYGYGLSERRFGQFLSQKPRDEYTICTKVGRLLTPDSNPDGKLWTDVPHFSPVVDYSASATRRSIEDSLQRLGIESIDVAYIHDLSPDFFGDKWEEHFREAEKGAMPELTKMREEGLIKGWGLGVNTLPPLLKTLEVADPNIFLSACQYSLVFHEEALETLFPKCEDKNVSVMVGAPLNFGFLSGRDRYNYGDTIPDGMVEKRAAIKDVADDFDVELRTAALQFSDAPKVVCSVIPGARNAEQAEENAKSFKEKIPKEFWETLKQKQLISTNAPTPA